MQLGSMLALTTSSKLYVCRRLHNRWRCMTALLAAPIVVLATYDRHHCPVNIPWLKGDARKPTPSKPEHQRNTRLHLDPQKRDVRGYPTQPLNCRHAELPRMPDFVPYLRTHILRQPACKAASHARVREATSQPDALRCLGNHGRHDGD